MRRGQHQGVAAASIAGDRPGADVGATVHLEVHLARALLDVAAGGPRGSVREAGAPAASATATATTGPAGGSGGGHEPAVGGTDEVAGNGRCHPGRGPVRDGLLVTGCLRP